MFDEKILKINEKVNLRDIPSIFGEKKTPFLENFI